MRAAVAAFFAPIVGGLESKNAADCPAQGTSPVCTLAALRGYQIIPAEELAISRRIGAGTEKVVYAGEWAGLQVAAMEVLGKSKVQDFGLQRQLAEHETLSRHPNLVHVFGQTSDGKYVLNELAGYGSLTNYDGSPAVLNQPHLGKGANLAVRLAMALQICAGAKALFDAGLLHRDMAARNVLCFKFSKTDPNEVLVKLTDFGLTIRIGADTAWPPGHAMGTRWMAPESQPDAGFEFSERSEVYMLGVVIWEIFSNGKVPYDQFSNQQIPSLKRRGIQPGPRSKICTDAVWELLQLCWEPFPVNRPSFAEILAMLTELQRSGGQRLRPDPAEVGPWVNRHPRVAALDEATLTPQFKELARAATEGGKSGALALEGESLIVYDPKHGVYAFPMFTEEFCDEIVDELSAFIASGRQTSRANSNNRYSLKLSELGFDGLLKPFASQFTQPLARSLLPGMSKGTLRFKQGHTVQRVADGAASPIPGSNRGSRHYDGCDVTLNVNIGGTWTGGDLLVFSEHQAKEPAFRVPQRKGWAVFHPGRVTHQAALLDSGCRFNLVIWADMF